MSTSRPFRKTLRRAASCRSYTPISALSGKGGGNAARRAPIVVLRAVTTPGRLAAILLFVVLGPAWPLPVCAQRTVVTSPISNTGPLTIENTIFRVGNSAPAISNSVLGQLTIIDCDFENNRGTGTGFGSAIVCTSTANIKDLHVTADQTSVFEGNTGTPGTNLGEGQRPQSIAFNTTPGILVTVEEGGLLDMRDPMGGVARAVTKAGQGVWALGGDTLFSLSNNTFPLPTVPTTFRVDSGTLYLYAANQVPNPSTLTGQVTAGTIALNGGSVGGFSSFTLGTGATLVTAGDNSISVNGSITLANDATIRGGTAADDSLLNLPPGRLPGGGPTSSLTLTAMPTNVVGLEGQLKVEAIASGDTFTLNANMANASGSTGSLLIPGAGTVILTGANTYTGPTTIVAGTLRAGAVDTLPSTTAVTVAPGAKLDLNDFNQSIGSLADPTGVRIGRMIAASVTLGSATLTTGNDNTNTTFSGVISGTGGLNKVGTGTFTLTGENTFTGPATIGGGTLELGNGGTTGDIVVNVINNGTVTFDHSNLVTFPHLISGAGAVEQEGTGTLILTANNTYSGGTTISAGTLVVGVPSSSQEKGRVFASEYPQ